MSRFSDRTRRVMLAATIGTILPAPAWAGVTPTTGKPTRVESMARVVDDAPPNVLRCWQQGRLIFEGAGFEPKPLPAAARGATITGASGQLVQLFDFQNALCILENRRS